MEPEEVREGEGAEAQAASAVAEPAPEDPSTKSEGPQDMEVESDKALPEQGHFTWKIEGFSELQEKKKYSDAFEVGGFKWRLLVFPRGNGAEYLSLYLDVADAEELPYNWTRSASFTLTLINHFDPERHFRKDAIHTFHQKESDWGFTQFMSLSDVFNDHKGFRVDDSVTIEAQITMRKDQFLAYDSREQTGHVGLKNQGATCYMNSLLQTLFHIPYFRKAVYHMPTASEDLPSTEKKSIPLALQSLFFKLQFHPTAVATKELTRSFGWDSMDAFTQHDVQELNRVLCEKLEEKMKGTSVENTIQHLFEGHEVNYIECINVDYKSTRKESFMDLQLDVKGCKDVYESFDKYVEVETLEGANQYRAEGHGLQDARKGVLFHDFPPVLQLQLKRFEYDFVRDMMVKVNEKYEFPEQLDLDRGEHKYLTKDADRSVRNTYTLYSVLVHSGGVHGGHYYAFIRPDGKQWLKFDDEKVHKVESTQAVDEQFGGDGDQVKFTKYSNAYMLVYIRDSDRDHILCEVTKEDIAEHLRVRLEKEQQEKEKRKVEKQEAHLYAYVKVATDKDIRNQIGAHTHFDLVDFDHPDVAKFRVRKQLPFEEVRALAAKELGIPVEKQRYWMWATRENRTYRPIKTLGGLDYETRICDLREPPGIAKNTLNLFLEEPLAGEPEPRAVAEGDILLFFKFFDPAQRKVAFVGRLFAPINAKVRSLHGEMCRMAGVAPEQELLCFEEIKNEPGVMCEKLDKHASLHKCQLEDGDIICFQVAMTDQQAAAHAHPYVSDYLNYIKNRQVVKFVRLPTAAEARPAEQAAEEKAEPSEPVEVEMSKLNTYNEVVEGLAASLGMDDPTKIRLTCHNCYSNGPRPSPLKYRGCEKLSDMLMHYNQMSDVLYYEILDIPLFELEQLKSLKVAFHDGSAGEVGTFTLRLPKESKVEEVLQDIRRRLDPPAPSAQLRLMEVFYHKIYKVFDEADKIDSINDQYWTLRAEAISDEERNMAATDRLIHVYHFATRNNGHTTQVQNFGNPFFFVVRENETLAQVKERIREKLAVNDEEFAKWKFAFCSMSLKPEYFSDEDVVITRFMRRDSYGPWEHYLGLEHEDKNPKARSSHQPSRHSYDKPIKIYT